MTESKLKTKDIITITLLTLINVVLVFAMSPLYATPITILLMPIIIALLHGIVFFILGTKVKKRGAIFIYCVIVGVFGVYPPYILAYIVTGLITEIILKKTGYGNNKGLLISYVIIQIAASFGITLYPYAIAAEEMFGQYTLEELEQAGLTSTLEASEILLSGGAVIVLVIVVIAAVIGGLIGSRIIRKHLSAMDLEN